jgi:hypothetical protein
MTLVARRSAQLILRMCASTLPGFRGICTLTVARSYTSTLICIIYVNMYTHEVPLTPQVLAVCAVRCERVLY